MTRPGMALMAAAAIVAAAATAQADQSAKGHGRERWGGFRGAGPEAAARVLNLTEAQRTAWDKLRAEHWKAIQPLLDEAHGIHTQMRQQLEAAQPDAEAVGKLAISENALRRQIETAHQDLERQFTQMLDTDQKAKYEVLRQLHGERRGPHGARPDGAEPPRGMEDQPER